VFSCIGFVFPWVYQSVWEGVNINPTLHIYFNLMYPSSKSFQFAAFVSYPLGEACLLCQPVADVGYQYHVGDTHLDALFQDPVPFISYSQQG